MEKGVVAEVMAGLKCLGRHGHGEGEPQTSELRGTEAAARGRRGQAGQSVMKDFTRVKRFGLYPNGEPLKGILQCDLGQRIQSIWAWFCRCLSVCLFFLLSLDK